MYVYNVDTVEGGDLALLRQHPLDGKRDESGKGVTKPDGPSPSLDAGAANSDTGIPKCLVM